MNLYPPHNIKCIIHANSDICNCGREEFEEEMQRDLEEENTIQEENTVLDSESLDAYREAMSKDN